MLVGRHSVEGDTITNVWAHVGDRLLAYAWRNGSNTAPSLATDWTSIYASGGSSNSHRVATMVAAESGLVDSLWQGATRIVILVFRSPAGTPAVGATAEVGGTAADITLPALSLTDAPSYVAASFGHRTATGPAAPTGLIERASIGTNPISRSYSTGEAVGEWAAQAIASGTAGGSGNGWRAAAVEIIPPAGHTEPEWPHMPDLPVTTELPDPLTMLDGTPVTTAEQWYEERLPELRALFSHYQLGYAPPAPASISVTKVLDKVIDDGTTVLEVHKLMLGPEEDVPLHLMIVRPNVAWPVPVLLRGNESGNHALHPDPDIPLHDTWTWWDGEVAHDDQRNAGTWEGFDWPRILGRGYAQATFYVGEAAPDRPWNFTENLIQAFYAPGQTERGAHDWGTIRCWSWAMSRALDVLVTLPYLRADSIFAYGMSRTGGLATYGHMFDDRLRGAITMQTTTYRTYRPEPHPTGILHGAVGVPQFWPAAHFDFLYDALRFPAEGNLAAAMHMHLRLMMITRDPDSPDAPGGGDPNDPHYNFEDPVGQWATMRELTDTVGALLGVDGLTGETYPGNDALVLGQWGWWQRPDGPHIVLPEDLDAMLAWTDAHLPGGTRRPLRTLTVGGVRRPVRVLVG